MQHKTTVFLRAIIINYYIQVKMKFTLALGLFLVGMANTQAIVPKQVLVDTFLRKNQDLNEGV